MCNMPYSSPGVKSQQPKHYNSLSRRLAETTRTPDRLSAYLPPLALGNSISCQSQQWRVQGGYRIPQSKALRWTLPQSRYRRNGRRHFADTDNISRTIQPPRALHANRRMPAAVPPRSLPRTVSLRKATTRASLNAGESR